MKLAVETAKLWSRPPSSVILGLDTRWSEVDSLLSMALVLDERAKCPGGCGQYMDEAHDPDMDGGYEVDDRTVCAACAARERWQAAHDKQRPEPGTLTWLRKLTKKRRGD